MPPRFAARVSVLRGWVARPRSVLLFALPFGLVGLIVLFLLGFPGLSLPVSAMPSADEGGLSTTGATLLATETATAVSSSDDPSVFGQSVTFTATVTRTDTSALVTSGSVTFKADDVIIVGCVGVALNASGQAACTTASLSVGSHVIAAEYSGDATFAPSTGFLTQVVNKADTTTTLTSTPNPSRFGEAITFSATVTVDAPGSATPTGVVYFNLEDGTTLGTAALNASGVATFSTSVLATGAHNVTAVYAGDENTKTSESAPLTQTVNRAQTTTALTSSVTPSVFGQPVTFEATVSVVAPGAGTPTGTITFKANGTPIGTSVLNGSGVASFTTSALAVGSHSITAAYEGDANFADSSTSITQAVNKADTITTIASAVRNPSVFGESVTFTALVTAKSPGSGTPTGNVVFKVDGTAVFTATLGFTNPGEARFSTTVGDNTEIDVGSRSITAEYLGDGNFNGSTSSAFTQTVNKANTSVTLQDPLGSSEFGQEVRITAIVQVDAPGAGTPTGDVEFSVNSTVVDTLALPAGRTSVTFITDTLPIGTNAVGAKYLGDGRFNPSSTVTVSHTVNRTSSETLLTSSVNPSAFGQTVTFTATVQAAGAGLFASTTPTGVVTFTLGSLGTVTGALDASGVATVVTDTLPVGVQSIQADYGGDGNFQPSSATLPQTVNKAGTTTTLTSVPLGSSLIGESVTFTATVTSTTGAVPTGTVTFKDGATELATVALDATGKASFTTATLAAGTHSIAAVYNGTANFNASISPRLDHNVTAAATTTTLTSSTNPSVFGQSVTFEATVTAAGGTPTGQVTFKNGTATIGTDTLDATGKASLTTAALSVGTHNITAVYGGDANFAGSTSNTVNQVVDPANTTTAITSDAPDASVVGEPVVVQYTVTAVAPGSGTPTGDVTVDDGTDSCTGTVAAGQCTLIPTTAGAKTLTATYVGDGNFNGSFDTEPHQVNQANTTTTVTSVPNPSLPGQSVTITATVTVNPPGSGTPTGTVNFKADGSSIAGCSSVALSSGSAACTTAFSAVGTVTLSAEYSGDANFNSSTGAATHTVSDTPADLSVTKTDSPDPVQAGDDVSYLITVSNPGPATDVTLTDSLPSETTFVSITAPGWSCTTPAVGSTGTVQCTKTGVTGTETLTIVVNVPITTPAGTVLKNTVQVTGSRPDPDLSNNTAVQETTVFRSPRFGDCNGDEAVDVRDIFSIVRRIFDPNYRGTAGCDANRDAQVDAGDVPCTALIAFNGPEACSSTRGALRALVTAPPLGITRLTAGRPALSMPEPQVAPGSDTVTVPIQFAANGHAISALTFSIDYDERWLRFDPADRDGNGVPDALVVSLPAGFDVSVRVDLSDGDGELDVFIGDTAPPLTALPDGVIAFVLLDVVDAPTTTGRAVRFSVDPAASFGDVAGRSVPGTATPAGRYRLFFPLVMRGSGR